VHESDGHGRAKARKPQGRVLGLPSFDLDFALVDQGDADVHDVLCIAFYETY